jgi:type IV pilus assembly protein PilE
MKTQGFTLIELMVVVAIIGILATVSLPMYTQYVQKGHRGTTQAEILSIERLQENYHLKNFVYAKNLSDLGFSSDTAIMGKYSVSAQTCNESGADVYSDVNTSSANEGLDLCYMIIATPSGAQAEDGVLVMDNRGRREFRNAYTSQTEDWQGNVGS